GLARDARPRRTLMTTTCNPIARGATAQAILVPLAVGVVAALAGYLVGSRTPAPPAAPAAAATSASGRRVLYWHDPMVPGQRFDKPGKSPFMDMALVPVYADAAPDGGVAVDSRLAQSLGVRTVEAKSGTLETG